MKKILTLLIGLIILVGGVFLGLKFLQRGTSATSDKFKGLNFICENEVVDKSDFDRIDGQYYLSFDFIKNKIDPNISYDNGQITINGSSGTKRFKVGENQALINNQTIGLRDPIIEKNGKIYLPIEAFIYDYPVDFRFVEDKNLILMDFTNKNYQIGTAKGSGTNMRESNSKSSPIVSKISDKDDLYVYGIEKGWYLVRQVNGYLGYVREDLIDTSEDRVRPHKEDNLRITKKPLNLLWDYTYGPQSDASVLNIRPIPGLNVICPTWFSIKDGSGEIIDRGRKDYVTKYNELGIQVWAYLDNSFSDKITKEFLSNSASRGYAINRLLNSCKKYGLTGLNIDFEQFSIENRDAFTEFVKEIYETFSKEKILVSVDVTPQISKDVSKETYNRAELSKYCDYLIVMTYDQHWSSSEKAGSVAQYKWVEGNINNLFKTVPREKLVLGMPLYSRYWSTKDNKTTSKTISMEDSKNIISQKGLAPKWDEESKQDYVEFQEDGATKQIWVEDASSIGWKASLCVKYNLAGLASWRKDFETYNIWDTIQNVLSNVRYLDKDGKELDDSEFKYPNYFRK
ncbi:SH3 domain protein [Clostridiales bacterium KA00134]|nr:SH3 domain protein [Clostridiales bacterium KA00134]